MCAQIPWELVADPFESVEHTSGTTALQYSKIYQGEKGTTTILTHIGRRRET
jgi:hypothetical protein